MSGDAQPLLLDYLTRRYGEIKLRLSRLLRNSDLAGDALQDTWLRLKTQDRDHAAIQSPGAYLVRMAAHAAVDIQRRQGRTLAMEEVQALLDLADTAPGPARVAELRSDLAELAQWLGRLPRRQREVIVMVRWEGLPQKEVARLLGVSLRTVELDLRRAHEYLDSRMGDAQSAGRGARPPAPSLAGHDDEAS